MMRRPFLWILLLQSVFCFFFSSRRRHTRFDCDWSSDVCSSDLSLEDGGGVPASAPGRARTARQAQAGVSRLMNRALAPALAAWLALTGLTDVTEIGRASCRERV